MNRTSETKMIHESAPWKDELELCSGDLFPRTTDCKEDVPFKLERALFLSAFIVRKLLENRKLTDKVASQRLDVSFHAAIDRERLAHQREMPGGLEIGGDFEEKGTKGEASFLNVANQIIHSLALYWVVDDDCLAEGFFVCSYKSQSKKAMLVSLDEWCRLIMSVAKDDVARSVIYTDAKTGKMNKKNFGWDEETLPQLNLSKVKMPKLDNNE